MVMVDSSTTRESRSQHVKRRKILGSLVATGAIGGGGIVTGNGDGGSSNDTIAKKRNRYSNPANLNRVIERHQRFVDSVFNELNVPLLWNDILVDDVSPPPKEGIEGEIVRSIKTPDNVSIRINIIRRIDCCPLNFVIHPESAEQPYAVLTNTDENVITTYGFNKVDGADAPLRVFTDEMGDNSSSTQSNHPPWACQKCPTDEECCECARECVTCCGQSCTTVWDYYCDCCKYTNPSCWGDCY